MVEPHEAKFEGARISETEVSLLSLFVSVNSDRELSLFRLLECAGGKPKTHSTVRNVVAEMILLNQGDVHSHLVARVTRHDVHNESARNQ